MPRLTPTGLRSRTGSSDRLGFGVPAYAHPLMAPNEWAELARPGTPLHWVALNVSRGPGTRPDPLYTEAVGRLREAAVPVIGVLDTRHGARPFAQLVSDAHHYLDWYGVDGFYLERAPTEREELSDCRRVTTTLRALLGAEEGGDGHIVLGHGSHPYPGYAEVADQLVTFCGPWTDYRWSEAPQWTAGYPKERFCHLVHGVPGPHLDNAMRIARWQGAATVFFTDRTDHAAWEGLPGYWGEVSGLLRRRPSDD
ncbi:spherulation-specific family 4 protein [Actinacidiphila soli]|uniref:spherulation-specific family 4 protein n=1 Tax=Actinacidiphila soli TaxID=2487275 RepID=UPI000FCBF857|nr:spherulation-specific family 4 protein [Actinacidiphila soli]